MSTPTLRELALRYLREQLTTGQLRPGDRLSDFTLSRQLGISRTPVRDAIYQLASEGLVEQRPREGAFVSMPDRREIEELYELREVLEGHAAAKVAASPGSMLLQALEKNGRLMKALGEDLRDDSENELSIEQTERQRVLDLEFHELILHAAGNRRTEKMVVEFQILGRVVGTTDMRMPFEILKTVCQVHDSIYEAIRTGRPDEARELMAGHIRHSLKRRLEALESAYSVHASDRVPEALRRYAR